MITFKDYSSFETAIQKLESERYNKPKYEAYEANRVTVTKKLSIDISPH